MPNFVAVFQCSQSVLIYALLRASFAPRSTPSYVSYDSWFLDIKYRGILSLILAKSQSQRQLWCATLGDCAIISTMGHTQLSANSQNIKKFQFHEKGRNLLFVVLFAATLFIGGVIYLLFSQYSQQSSSAELVTDFDTSEAQTATPNTDETATATSQDVSSPSYIPQNTNPTTTTNNAAPSGLPNGVFVALDSLEANGIVGNTYVSSSLDVSNLPDNATVQFQRDTWSQTDASSGSLNATVNAFSQTYQGSVTFTLESDGTWRVTGYGLS